MKLKLTITLLVGVVIGVFGYQAWYAHTATGRHWRAVREHMAYMRNPENYEPAGNGLVSTEEPFDVMPHLAALVSADEVIHADIILPSVSSPNRAVTKHWMAFCQRYPEEIVYSYGSCEPGPLHFNLWYTEAGQPLIDQLLQELKEIGKESTP
jgi:hypothetical protein